MRDRIQNHIAYALAQANRGVHLRFGELLKAEGIQVEHWRILEVLSDESGRSMGELAEAVLMNHPALTKMIDRMVAAGIVHRSLDPADNRRVLVFCDGQGPGALSPRPPACCKAGPRIHREDWRRECPGAETDAADALERPQPIAPAFRQGSTAGCRARAAPGVRHQRRAGMSLNFRCCACNPPRRQR